MGNIISKFNLNSLGDELIDIIKQRSNIFNKITIVVPNNRTEQWFKAYWLKHQNDVLMNVVFKKMDNKLKDLIDSDGYFDLMSLDQLKTLIMKHLPNIYDLLPDEIKEYIYENDKLHHIKLYDLSNKLASLFFEYEIDQINITGWQEKLYNKVLENALEYELSTISYMFNKCNRVKKINNPLYFFGFISFNNLEKKIIDKIKDDSNVTLFMLEKNSEYSSEFDLISVPSKLREIEAVHSKICTLLLDQNNKYEDFLVIAPNISVYEDVIPRVFNQDDEEFPNIPYIINDRKKIDTNISSGFEILIDIANKKFFTRLDFFNIINNSDIQITRNITLDDVDNWSRYLIDINAYRNSPERDDWDYARKRILLSKVAGISDIDQNIVELNNKKYLPFTTIDFDSDSIVKFVSVIDDLKKWLDLVNSIEFINNNNLLSIKNELDKWFSLKDVNEFETNKYYKNIVQNIEFWLNANVSNNLIPRNTIFYSLLDASKITKVRNSDYFTKGITFADFDTKAVLSCKYVFFLNASSANLPIPVIKNELDIRSYNIYNKDEIENAFLIQFQNADKFVISYINKDLKTDEDFYPSTFVGNLSKTNKMNETKIDIDETRSWAELFTRKSYFNKDYFVEILNNSSNSKPKLSEQYKSNIIKKIYLKDLADFLEEPLKNKAKHLFGYDDNLEEEIENEFEPFFLNNIVKGNLFRKICVDVLNNKKKELNIDDFNKIKERFNLECKLPNINELLNDTAFKKVFDLCVNFIHYIYHDVGENFDVYKLDDVILNNNDNEVVLTCNNEMCVSEQGNKIIYFEIKELKNTSHESDFLNSYVFALVDVLKREECEYEIVLDRGKQRIFKVTPSEALDLLTKISLAKVNYEENVYLPVNKFYEEKRTFSKVISELNNDYSPWEYFSQQKLFDYDTDLGYTTDDFDIIYTKKRNEHIKLIKFLEPIEAEGEKNGN